DVQALAHLMNTALGNVGKTLTYAPPVEVRSEDQLASLRALVDDMAAERVEMLLILGGDPAFNAPVDLPFADAMAKVPLRIHLSLYANDTAALYDGKSAHELLAVAADGPTRAGYDIVRGRWQTERRVADFDDQWRSWL